MNGTAMRPESERRHFKRMEMHGALALDALGRKIGPVVEVSGGGMMVGVGEDSARLLIGTRFTVTIVEESGLRQSVDVEVRHQGQASVGLKFVGGDESGPE